MPATDSPAIIIARFLKSNNYSESYEAFVQEAGLSYNAGVVSKGDLTLEVLLEEKKAFDLSVQFEKLGTDETSQGWSQPAPSEASEISVLPSRSNLLGVSVEFIKTKEGSTQQTLLASTADRRLNTLSLPSLELQNSLVAVQDSPILDCVVIREHYLLTASMSGHLTLSDTAGKLHDRRRDHSKYVVKIAVIEHDAEGLLIATAGWDNKVLVYRPRLEPGEAHLGTPSATITLPSKPEALLFIRHPYNDKPALLLTRTDSSFLYYYTATEELPRAIGRQNLAPHSNAWVAFTPSALASSPTDPSLVAVATSAVPHMKVIIVRLLVPPYEGTEGERDLTTRLRTSLLDDGPATETQASQARAQLAVADKEAAAILIHCTTMSPQTAYSTPAVAWRPDGSGVWVNGDDGLVRGIEATTGKIVASLQGHEAGSKVRCLWAGTVGDGEEWLVSGGFDQRLIVWKP